MKTLEESRNEVVVEDEREQEDWFQELPPEMQMRHRERWHKEAEHEDELGVRQRQRVVQTLVEGLMTFGMVEFFVYGLTVFSGVVVALIGLAVGWVWHHFSTDRFQSLLIGLGGLLLIRLIVGQEDDFGIVFEIVLVAGASAALAVPRENASFGI